VCALDKSKPDQRVRKIFKQKKTIFVENLQCFFIIPFHRGCLYYTIILQMAETAIPVPDFDPVEMSSDDDLTAGMVGFNSMH
jgi:hypothetical protein